MANYTIKLKQQEVCSSVAAVNFDMHCLGTVTYTQASRVLESESVDSSIKIVITH